MAAGLGVSDHTRCWLWRGLDQSVGDVGAAGIRFEALTAGVDREGHILQRDSAQEHGVTQHQGAHKADPILKAHLQRTDRRRGPSSIGQGLDWDRLEIGLPGIAQFDLGVDGAHVKAARSASAPPAPAGIEVEVGGAVGEPAQGQAAVAAAPVAGYQFGFGDQLE